MTETSVPARALDPVQAQAAGDRLRRHRRDLGLRVRHLATKRLPSAALKAVERGTMAIDAATLTDVASVYGLDLALVVARREPLVVNDCWLAIGDRTSSWERGSTTSAVAGYLTLLLKVRDETDEAAPITRTDILTLASALDEPCVTVISRIADHLGGDGARTRAMVTLYLEGATVVGAV